jgi:hypothetical protein
MVCCTLKPFGICLLSSLSFGVDIDVKFLGGILNVLANKFGILQSIFGGVFG